MGEMYFFLYTGKWVLKIHYFQIINRKMVASCLSCII